MTVPPAEERLSVAQVNRMIRSLIEAETLERYFWISGKIDRYYKSERGHIYFDLVDEKTRIRCMLREEQRGSVPFELRNHLHVHVRGDVHYYVNGGEAQINVIDVRLVDTKANATPATERLRAEGLYPPKKRKPPERIRRVGIVTSQSSRAIGDFENAYRGAGERGVLAPVAWKYVMLEGDRARQSIVGAIASLDRDDGVDLIAIIRGGGRYENLAVFDSYEIARAVASCQTYIITGIGHHKDQALADEMADHAASTPTAVAHFVADLCLGPQPRRSADWRRRQSYGAAAIEPRREMPWDDEAIEPNLDMPWDDEAIEPRREMPWDDKPARKPLESQQRPPAAKPSRAFRLLVVVLLVVALASVGLLLAVLITQAP